MPPGDINVTPFTMTCLVCGKVGQRGDTSKGWRLAPNRIGGYTCSLPCDAEVVAYDDRMKEAAKAAKKANKKLST